MEAKGRRKPKQLSLEDKVKLIKEVDKYPNMKRVELARMLNMNPSTLNCIINNRRAILSAYGLPGSPKRKRVRPGKFWALEDELLKWLRQARASNIPIDGNVIKEKAFCLADKMNIPNFKASNGWMDRFKIRHGITYKRMSDGEVASVSDSQMWANVTLSYLLKDYVLRDVFNIQEIGLFFNLTPNEALEFTGKSCCGGEHSTERLTLLLCANEDGTEKLPPLVIGKFAEPSCFEDVRTLPCRYTGNDSAWVTTSMFEAYLRALDGRMEAEGRKIMLFLNQCAAHVTSTGSYRNIKLVMFPDNCLQPLDQGVIEHFKRGYRRCLVSRMQPREYGEERPRASMLDAMLYIKNAWDGISSPLIADCFRRAGFRPSDVCVGEGEGVTEEEWAAVAGDLLARQPGANFNDYVTFDDRLVVCGEASSPEDIYNGSIEPRLEDGEQSQEGQGHQEIIEEELGDGGPATPTFADALEAMDIIWRYTLNFGVDDHTVTLLSQIDNELFKLDKRKH